MRLQPYKQISLKQLNKDNKLAPKYYGPYKVLQKIGSMAYKLEILASSRVHPVFLVYLLNNVIGDKILVQIIFLELDEEGKVTLEYEKKSSKQGSNDYEIWLLLSTSPNGRIYEYNIRHGKMSLS